MTAPIRLDYDEVVASYAARLETELRGFSAGASFLDTWVPDPDPEEGILSMIDAARHAGLEALLLRVGGETARRLEEGSLARGAARIGARLRIEHEDGGLLVSIEVSVASAGGAAEPAHEAAPRAARAIVEERLSEDIDVRAGYLPKIREVLDRIEHEGELPPGVDGVRVEARDGEVAIAWLVDPAHHTVRAARHDGARGALRAILEQQCRAIGGLPVQEASDHGTHAAELALRPDGARAVRGVVTPLSAGGSFRAALALAQRALAAYRVATGYAEEESRFSPSPSQGWRDRSGEERAREITACLARTAAALGLGEGAVELVDLREETKVAVAFASSVTTAARRAAMLRLEAALQRDVEPTLSLERPARKDLNAIRRL